MKISCGTDIIEIQRIKNSMERHEDGFKDQIFTQSEIEYCESRKSAKYQHYAARFAAKEAIFKAISKYLDNDYTWKDFEVVREEDGKPVVVLKTDIPEIESIDISLSHCKEYATANVVVLFK